MPDEPRNDQSRDDDRTNDDVVGRLREEQVRLWQRGEPLSVEKLVESSLAAQDLDSDSLLDLIYGEVLLREEAGERPTADEYVARFPTLADSIRRQFAVHVAWPQETTTTRQGDSPLPNIPQYDILEMIGRGGAGVVYRARDRQLKRLVALKLLRDWSFADDTSRSRFRAEAEAVARLHHPHIVQIYEYGEADACPYLSLEYVPDGTLEAWCRSPRSIREIATMIATIAEAVGFAHAQGIVHRDLKPANVLLAKESPKIADFGLAKQTEGDLKLTQSAAILGTGAYMSPEQAWGKSREVGPATDVHALGVMLYELLTGETPFHDESLIKTLDRVRFETAPSPRSKRPDTPLALEAICLRCLAKSTAERYADGGQLATDLRRFLDHETSEAQTWLAKSSSDLTSSPWKKWSSVVVASLVCLIATIMVVVQWNKSNQTTNPIGSSATSANSQVTAAPIVRTTPEVFALLVGVRSYQFGDERLDLEYTEADVDELSRVLLRKGVPRKNIRLLTQWGEADNPTLSPTADNIRRQVREFLANCIEGDTVWIAVTGMGGESGPERVYCYLPADAQVDRRETVLPLSELYDLLGECRAGRKLLIVDTCQTATLPDFGLKLPAPPPGVAALFACSRAEASYEHADLRHGVFSYQILRGLEGAADVDRDGTISVGELHNYARVQVRDFLESHLPDAVQTPLLEASLDRNASVLPP